MAVLMISASIFLFVIGKRRDTQNILVWTLIPLLRGFHWLVEYIAEIIDNPPFILDRVETSLAIASSFLLFSAILEYSGFTSQNSGKWISLIGLFTFYFFLFLLPEHVINEIEDIEYFSDFVLVTDPFRLFYGFLLPFSSLLILIRGFNIAQNENIELQTSKSNVFIFMIILFVFSIFEGFDLENDVYIFFRSLILAGFIIFPLLIIYSSNLGLKYLFISTPNGIPIFAYHFQSESTEIDSRVILTSGFITALMGLSSEINDSPAQQSELTAFSNEHYLTIRNFNEYLLVLLSRYASKLLIEEINMLVTDEIHKVIITLIENQNKGDMNSKLASQVKLRFQNYIY